MKTTIVVDNGAGTLKVGFAGENEPKVRCPNCTASLPKQIGTLIGSETIDRVKNKSSLRYASPFDRGYLINYERQAEIWTHVFEKTLKVKDMSDRSLLVTEPPLNPDVLKKRMREIAFETFGFESLAVATPQRLVSYDCTFRISTEATTTGNEQRHELKDGFMDGCMVVVDAGYSFTHAVPLFRHEPVANATRRVDVGGKFLTNILKEMVSYTSFNVMEDTYIINNMKEKLCFCSSDLYRDLKVGSRANRELRREFVLPDFVTTMEGYVRPVGENSRRGVTAGGTKRSKEQVIVVGNERVRVPEILFHPSDVGMKEGGVADAVVQAIEACPAHLRPCLYSNIVLTGGTSQMSGFSERLHADIRAAAPDVCGVHVRSVDVSSAWRGGSRWADSTHHDHTNHSVRPFSECLLSKKEYMERG